MDPIGMAFKQIKPYKPIPFSGSIGFWIIFWWVKITMKPSTLWYNVDGNQKFCGQLTSWGKLVGSPVIPVYLRGGLRTIQTRWLGMGFLNHQLTCLFSNKVMTTDHLENVGKLKVPFFEGLPVTGFRGFQVDCKLKAGAVFRASRNIQQLCESDKEKNYPLRVTFLRMVVEPECPMRFVSVIGHP